MTAAMVVAVVTVGVATPTTATEETVEAEEAHLVEAVAREPVRFSDEVAGTVAAALGEAAVGDGTAREVVRQVTVPLSARPRLPRRGLCGDRKKVSRDVEEGASGPEAFNLLLRRLMTHSSNNPIFMYVNCLLYTSPSPRDKRQSRMPSSA